MLAAFFAMGCLFDDGPLFIAVVVGIAVILATTGRRSSQKCTRCHQMNREEASFCAQCGKRLSDR